MNATEPQPPLRPLGLGEVLDRAVNLCVRYFVPFSAIYLVFAIPFAVVTYFATKDFQAMLQSLTDAIQHGASNASGPAPRDIARILSSGGGFNGWSVALIVLAFAIAPLPAAALTEATAAAYLGRLPTFAESYRAGLGRWMPLIGVNVMYAGVAILLYLVIIIALTFVFFALAFLTAALHWVGITVDVVVGVAALLAIAAVAVVATLAWQVSYFTCVVERTNTIVAFARGVTRVFVGVGLKRSLLIGVAYVAIGLAVAMVSFAGQSVLIGLLHSGIAGTVYATIVRIATAAFTTAFVGIFYFDLRVREEGLDLTLAAADARTGVLEAT